MAISASNSHDPLVLMGGTFDPIHHGHLRLALEVRELLGVESLQLVPSATPVHRAATQVSAQDRLAMLRLAVASESGLEVDPCEIERDSASYTALTLAHKRQQIGADRPLCWVMGADSFLTFLNWREPETILSLAHLVVINRPGYPLAPSLPLLDLMAERQTFQVGDLAVKPAGSILMWTLPELEVSATAVRDLIAAGRSPRYLIPDLVWDYIKTHQLYGANAG